MGKRYNPIPTLILGSIACTMAPAAAELLTLEAYQRQVDGSNLASLATRLRAEAGEARQNEGTRSYIPALTAGYQTIYDRRPTLNPSFQGFKTEYNNYSMGIAQQTPWGMTAGLSYNLQRTHVFGANALFVPLFDYYDAFPKLELSQPLWGGFFGNAVRARIDAQNAAAAADAAEARHGLRAQRMSTELTYLHLALSRKTVSIQKDALARAKALKSWADRRARLNLADRTDLLQSEANYKIRELELASAQHEEMSAAREFNTMRHIDSDTVPEELQDLAVDSALKLALPERVGVREDVHAAEARASAAAAASIIAREETQPQLNATGFYALYKRSANRSSAMDDPMSFSNPYWGASVNLSMPLDLITQNRLRQARNRERDAADLQYQDVNFKSEREWLELNRKHSDYKTQLELAASLETVQKEKLTNERTRLERGRTTTYQVLLFEQDYSNAQLNRLQAQTRFLQNYIRMKLWSAL